MKKCFMFIVVFCIMYAISAFANEDKKYKIKKVKATVTAYCPCKKCCGKYANGKTSTGNSAYEFGIAADPKRIPYGTILCIEGYGISVVDDTGGAMRRNQNLHFDVRFPTHKRALEWGRKEIIVEIYEEIK